MLKNLSLIIGGALLAHQAFAHHITANFNLGNMANQSDLVFRGKVVDIAYRGSNPNKGGGSIPHTFVTYSVDDVLFGNPGDSKRRTFTLRFMGGRGDKNKVMLVQQLPQFDVGDEDILFVNKNGSSECPLVDCVNGRFRIVDDMVYNEYGQKLLRTGKDQIVLGNTEKRDEFSTFTIGDQTFTRQSHSSETQDFSEGDDSTGIIDTETNEHLDASTFAAISREKISTTVPNDPAGKNRIAKNADKSRPFTLPAPKPVTVAVPKFDIPVEKPVNDQEKAELESMSRNGRNPVIQ